METLLGFFIGLLSIFGGAAVNAELPSAAQMTNDVPRSVELGITELSPRGHAGGYAMPASVSSNPALEVRVCDLVAGSNGSIIYNEYGDYAGYTWNGTDCTMGTKNIRKGEQVEVQWRSRDVDSCSVVAGGARGFSLADSSTGETLGGSDESITEPPAATQYNFRVSCTYTAACISESGTCVLESQAEVYKLAECEDGIDNDDTEDTLADYGSDPGCSSATDDDESNGTRNLRSQNLQVPSLTVGVEATFRADVNSNGTVGTGSGFTDIFEYSYSGASGPWTTGKTINRSAHAAGQVTTDQVNFALPSAGDVWIQHCVDHGNAISESDESVADNCEVTGPITVSATPKPDLVAYSTGPAAGASFTEGTAITFTGRVTNEGAADMTQTGVHVHLHVDYGSNGSNDISVDATTNLGPLAQGASFTNLNYTRSTIPVGTHRYRYFADGHNAVTNEITKSNNTSPWRTFTVTAAAINGACDSNSAKTYPYDATSYDGSLCTSGNADPSNPSFPSQGGQSSWICRGANGGSDSSSCIARRNPAPICDDGIDNDGDGLTDYDGGDPGCTSKTDNDEENSLTCTGADLTADPRVIRKGDTTTLTWTNSTDGATCTLSGGELTNNEVTVTNAACTDEQTVDVNPQNITTYTLTCDEPFEDGDFEKEVTVQVTPNVDEN